jgi:kynurenine formamidase
MMKLYDLSEPWSTNPYVENWVPETWYQTGGDRAVINAKTLGLQPTDFRDSWALQGMGFKANMAFHLGCHADAPRHFGQYCEGKPSRTIDQLPIEWFYGDGVILDLRHKEPRSGITITDIEKALAEINYTLKPLDIVFIMTGYDKYRDDERYLRDQPGMTGEATGWIIDRGVKVIGIDCYTFDRPFGAMADDVRAGKKENLFPAHFIGRDKEYVHIEKLCDLDTVPVRHGFIASVFPTKVKDGDAGYVRAVAIVNE